MPLKKDPTSLGDQELHQLRTREANYVEQIKALIRDKNNLEAIKTNQQEELVELRAKKLLTPEEWNLLQGQTAEIVRYMQMENKLSMWLRNNKSVEITQGKHKGMDLADIMIMYAAVSCVDGGTKQ